MGALKGLVSGLLEWFRNEPVTLGLTPLADFSRIDPIPTRPFKGDPRNVPGEYAVEADCCLVCGVPWHYAPDLFDHDDSGCWVKRQPVTEDERARMLQVIDAQDAGCIQRRGSDGNRILDAPGMDA